MDPTARVSLGKTGLQVTRLGLGTNPLGGLYEPIPRDVALKTVEVCWELGIRFFDTAPVYGYGNSERIVGEFLRAKPRDEYVLATKVGRLLLKEGPPEREDTMVLWGGKGGVPLYRGTDDVKPYFDFSYDGVMRSIEASQKRMGIDRFDILHIHDPDWFPNEAIEGAYKALDELRRNGVIKAVGCGVNQWEILVSFAQQADFDCFLLAGRYTLLDQSALRELLPLCEEKNIAIIGAGVYNSGILASEEPEKALEVGRDAGSIPQWKDSITYNYIPADKPIVDKVISIKRVCDRHKVPLMAAAIQFPLFHPAIPTVLMGPRNPEQARQNYEMLAFEIPSEFWSELKHEKLIPEEAPTP